MAETPEGVALEIHGQTLSSIRLIADEGEGRSEIVALVFDEKVADEITQFLTYRFPLPEGVVVGVKLESVHPNEVERWVMECVGSSDLS